MKRANCLLPMALLALFGAGEPALAASQKADVKSGNRAAALYHNYCSVCHGDRGDGNSRARGGMNPPPKDFTTASTLTRDYMIAIVKNGKPGTAMAGWSTQLSDKDTADVVDYVRQTFMRIALDPKLQEGRKIYVERCSKCHGERGEGKTLAEFGMNVAPRNFATPQARATLSRDTMLDAVKNGKSGTAMISFRDSLKAKEIAAVVDFIRAALMVPEMNISGTHAHGGGKPGAPAAPSNGPVADMTLPMPNGLKGDPKKGKAFYLNNCATCHGNQGDGKGPRAYFINPRPKNFVEQASRNRLNRPSLFTFISAGKLGTEMPAWSKVLSEQEIADVGEYVFQAFIQPKKSDK